MNFEPLRALMETLVAEGVPGCELAVCRGFPVFLLKSHKRLSIASLISRST